MDTRIYAFAAILGCGSCLLAPGVTSAAGAADWQGFYIGANVGYVEDKGVNYTGLGISTQEFDITGSSFGIQGGYNWAVGPVVIGVEGNASSVDADGSAPCPNPTYSCGAKVDQLYSVRARVGYPISNFLLYGTLGAAQGDVEARAIQLSTGVNYGNSATQTGMVVGIGGEYAFTANLIGRVEVAYIDLGNNDYLIQGTPIKIETQLTTARIGASWKF